MLNIGDTMDTSMEIDVVENGEPRTASLEDLLVRPTVLSIYMSNNTSSCDKQNQDLVDGIDRIREAGYDVIAIAKNGTRSHSNYAEKLGISYTLASDPDHKIADALDAIVEKNMYGKTYEGPARSAFILDTDGTVLAVIEKVDTAGHVDQILSAIDEIEG